MHLRAGLLRVSCPLSNHVSPNGLTALSNLTGERAALWKRIMDAFMGSSRIPSGCTGDFFCGFGYSTSFSSSTAVPVGYIQLFLGISLTTEMGIEVPFLLIDTGFCYTLLSIVLTSWNAFNKLKIGQLYIILWNYWFVFRLSKCLCIFSVFSRLFLGNNYWNQRWYTLKDQMLEKSLRNRFYWLFPCCKFKSMAFWD